MLAPDEGVEVHRHVTGSSLARHMKASRIEQYPSAPTALQGAADFYWAPARMGVEGGQVIGRVERRAHRDVAKGFARPQHGDFAFTHHVRQVRRVDLTSEASDAAEDDRFLRPWRTAKNLGSCADNLGMLPS